MTEQNPYSLKSSTAIAETSFETFTSPDISNIDRRQAKRDIISAVDLLIRNYDEFTANSDTERITRRDWSDLAACRKATNVFDQVDAKPRNLKNLAKEQAARLCGACVVRDECLEFALDTEDKHPLIGGMTLRERNRLLRERKAVESTEAA